MFTYSKEGKEPWFDGSDSCYNPRYAKLPSGQDEAINYRIERQFLKTIGASTVVYYLNGEPTTAEERLHTVREIMREEGY
jgi:hypothetical protein